MSLFDTLKILFEQINDEDYLQRMGNLLSDGEKTIEALKKREECLNMEHLFITLEHFTLSEILKNVQYQKNYQQELESLIDQLLDATLKLGHILQRVEWHKIQNYDEHINSEQQRENEHIRREMEILFKRMEGRNVAIEFRREQQRKVKLTSMLEDVKKAMSLNRKRKQSIIDAALKKRNTAILDLVAGSKNLKELRSKQMLQKSTVKPVRIQNIQQLVKPFNLTSNVLPSEVEKPVIKSFDKPIENYFEQQISSETEFKPTKISHNIHFNVLNFDKLVFEEFEVNPKVVDDLLENESTTKTLQSILHKPSKNSKESATNQSKNENRVKFLSPAHSEINFEDQNSLSTIASNQEINYEKEKATTCSKKAEIPMEASEQMETDIFAELREQIRGGNSEETKETHKDQNIEELANKEKSKLHLDKGKKRTKVIFEEQTIEENFLLNEKNKVSKANHPRMNEQNSSLGDLLQDISPQKMDAIDDLHFSDEGKQSNLHSMLFFDSDCSESAISSRRNSRKTSDEIF